MAEKAANVLRAGGVVLLPTDTLYALGADALSNAAVDAIYIIKGRDEKKPMHALVADMAMAQRYAEVPENARILSEKLPRGKLTLVCKKKQGTQTGIARGIDTFGFRIPDHDLCNALLRAFGGPITATSANRGGQKPANAINTILAQLGRSSDLIDLVIDAGELPERVPSTVVDLSSGKAIVLREGAVPAADIAEILGH